MIVKEAILEYCREKNYRKQIVDRWLALPEEDRSALLELAVGLKLGENHFRDFFDWLEEIALRDGTTPCNVLKGQPLAAILSDPRLGRSDRLKRSKEELRRIRFPRMARIEDEIQKRLRELELKPHLRISVPPALEGEGLTVQVKAASYEELKQLVEHLREALERDSMKEIFALLRGEVDAGF
jgi:hypothetical protein